MKTKSFKEFLAEQQEYAKCKVDIFYAKEWRTFETTVLFDDYDDMVDEAVRNVIWREYKNPKTVFDSVKSDHRNWKFKILSHWEKKE